MRSSKMENVFNYPPPVEEAKTLPPFAYYQPFRSGFDPDLSVNGTKSPGRDVPPQMKRWGQGASGSLRASGGGILTPPECDNEGPRPFPGTSTSSWGEAEGRSLCNSTWRTPRASFSGFEDLQGPARCTPGSIPPGPHSQLQKSEAAFAGLCRPGLGAFGSPLCPPAGQVTNFESSSPYFPVTLNSLGKNASQNAYKSGHGRPMMCNFCKNNKEVPDIYLNHYLYDPATKVLSCPVLRKHVCEVCGGTGDQAHTLQYCPVNRERGLQSKFPVLLKTRTITNSTGKIRRN